MTEKLKTLMHEQAGSVDFAAPDLDAMVHTGDRRVRTRRIGALAGAAAVLAAVALTAPLLSSSDRAVAPAAPGAAAPVSWVEGSTLHTGEETFELSFRPLAYVRTAEGYVFSDRDGNVWSWVDGASTKVGRAHYRNPRLVSDEESGLAGWVDLSDATDESTAVDEAEYAVLDQATGDVRAYPAPDGIAPEQFRALDAGTAYWEGAEGLVAVALDSRRSTPIDLDGTVADVEDGLVAVRTEAGISVRELAGQELRMLDGFYGEAGSFSPDARYLTNDADVPQVYDVAVGEQVEVPVGDREFASGYEWLDDTTLALIASEQSVDSSRVQLLTCELAAGSCETVTTLGTFDEMVDRLVIPVGSPIDG